MRGTDGRSGGRAARMGAEEASLLRDFPLLLPEDHTLSSYHGFITAHGVDYRVRFSLPKAAAAPASAGGVLSGARLHGAPELWALLEAHGAWGMLEQRLTRAASVHEFFVELRELVERLHGAQVSPDPGSAPADGPAAAAFASSLSLDPAVYMRLVEEISEVGWSRVTGVEEGGSSELHLTLELDVDGRSHVMSVALPPNYPRDPPRCAAALPEHVELTWAVECAYQGHWSAPCLAVSCSSYTVDLTGAPVSRTQLARASRTLWPSTVAQLHRTAMSGPSSTRLTGIPGSSSPRHRPAQISIAGLPLARARLCKSPSTRPLAVHVPCPRFVFLARRRRLLLCAPRSTVSFTPGH